MGRKNEIIKKATRLFAEYGYSGTSMSELARRVEVTKAALYYYFKSKRELYLQSISASYKNIWQQLESIKSLKLPEEEKLRKVISVYLEASIKEKGLLQSSYQAMAKLNRDSCRKIAAFKGNIFKTIKNLVSGLSPKKRKIDSQVVARFILGALDGLILSGKGFSCSQINKFSRQLVSLIV